MELQGIEEAPEEKSEKVLSDAEILRLKTNLKDRSAAAQHTINTLEELRAELLRLYETMNYHTSAGEKVVMVDKTRFNVEAELILVRRDMLDTIKSSFRLMCGANLLNRGLDEEKRLTALDADKAERR